MRGAFSKLAGLIFIILLAMVPDAVAQKDFIVVRGVVRDSRSGMALEYASVSIIGRTIGTMSNAAGEFEFNIPAIFSEDTLAVSFIGYENFKIVIRAIPSHLVLNIAMRPAAYHLRDIVVHSGPYTVESLIADVLKHYPENYGNAPYLLEGFYRETRKNDERYGYLLEAACHTYKENYRSEYVTALDRIRSSLIQDGNLYDTDENFLEALLRNDYVTNPYMGFYRNHKRENKFVMEDTTVLDGDPVYVIAKGSLPGWITRYYINASNYAILKFEGESNYGFTSANVAKPAKDTEFRYRHLKVINTFGKAGEKYFLSYISMILDGDNGNGNYLVFDREFLVNKIRTENVTPISKTEAMASTRLENQLQPYDPDFWKNYNILTRTPVQEKIVRDLSGKKSLHDQFGTDKPVTAKKRKRD